LEYAIAGKKEWHYFPHLKVKMFNRENLASVRKSSPSSFVQGVCVQKGNRGAEQKVQTPGPRQKMAIWVDFTGTIFIVPGEAGVLLRRAIFLAVYHKARPKS